LTKVFFIFDLCQVESERSRQAAVHQPQVARVLHANKAQSEKKIGKCSEGFSSMQKFRQFRAKNKTA